MAVDEMMAKFFERTILKQFIKGKPIRFGLKFWGLCTPDGYLLDLDLYCGKNSAVGENKLPKCSLGSCVVLSLLQGFFSSVGVKKKYLLITSTWTISLQVLIFFYICKN